MALEQVFAWYTVQRCATVIASTRQPEMPRSDFFAFVDHKSIGPLVEDNDFGSINLNLAFAFDFSVIRSQQRTLPVLTASYSTLKENPPGDQWPIKQRARLHSRARCAERRELIFALDGFDSPYPR
jgi:hypothetical protein